MKFQNHVLKFEQTDGCTDEWKDGRAQSNMPPQLFQSWVIKTKYGRVPIFMCVMLP